MLLSQSYHVRSCVEILKFRSLLIWPFGFASLRIARTNLQSPEQRFTFRPFTTTTALLCMATSSGVLPKHQPRGRPFAPHLCFLHRNLHHVKTNICKNFYKAYSFFQKIDISINKSTNYYEFAPPRYTELSRQNRVDECMDCDEVLTGWPSHIIGRLGYCGVEKEHSPSAILVSAKSIR